MFESYELVSSSNNNPMSVATLDMNFQTCMAGDLLSKFKARPSYKFAYVVMPSNIYHTDMTINNFVTDLCSMAISIDCQTMRPAARHNMMQNLPVYGGNTITCSPGA